MLVAHHALVLRLLHGTASSSTHLNTPRETPQNQVFDGKQYHMTALPHSLLERHLYELHALSLSEACHTKLGSRHAHCTYCQQLSGIWPRQEEGWYTQGSSQVVPGTQCLGRPPEELHNIQSFIYITSSICLP